MRQLKTLQGLSPQRENASHNVITKKNITLHCHYKSHKNNFLLHLGTLGFKSKCNPVGFWHHKFTWLLIKWFAKKKMLNSSQFEVSVLVYFPYHIEQLIMLREHPLPPERKMTCFSQNCVQKLWEVAVSSIFPWDTVILPQSSLSFQLDLCVWCTV